MITDVEITCGPNKIAYTLVGGVLKVWVGDAAQDAPVDAYRSEILEGFTTWAMHQTQSPYDVDHVGTKGGSRT